MGVRGVLSPIIPWLLLISLFPPSQASSGDVQFRECMEDMLHLISQLKQKVEKCQMSNGTTVEPQPDASAATTTGNPISLSSTVCDSNPCLNGGTCWLGAASRSNKYKCACPDDFSGDNCEEKVTCTEDSCKVDDDCYVANHRTNCVCKRKHPLETPSPTSPPTTTSIPTTTRKYNGSCAEGWFYFDKYCYKIGSRRTFRQARNTCARKRNGAHLASIHSLEENDFVRRIWLLKHPLSQNLWIGMFYNQIVNLTNVDGSAVDYKNFGPQHYDGSNNCVASGRDGLWNDYACNKKFHYLCKKADVPQ